jgi:hypothetical protein
MNWPIVRGPRKASLYRLQRRRITALCCDKRLKEAKLLRASTTLEDDPERTKPTRPTEAAKGLRCEGIA